MKGKTFVKPNQKLIIGLIVLGTGLLGITTFYSLSDRNYQHICPDVA